MRKAILLLSILLWAEIAPAAPSADILRELSSVRPQKVFRTSQSMPEALREALRTTFKQERLSLANPGEPLRENELVIGGQKTIPPSRRLILGFETARFFFVYYQAGGYENAAKVLAFSKQPKNLSLAWGGAAFDYKSGATPQWLSKQIRNHKFLDDGSYIW
jgi:hypothetical protein